MYLNIVIEDKRNAKNTTPAYVNVNGSTKNSYCTELLHFKHWSDGRTWKYDWSGWLDTVVTTWGHELSSKLLDQSFWTAVVSVNPRSWCKRLCSYSQKEQDSKKHCHMSWEAQLCYGWHFTRNIEEVLGQHWKLTLSKKVQSLLRRLLPGWDKLCIGQLCIHHNTVVLEWIDQQVQHWWQYD